MVSLHPLPYVDNTTYQEQELRAGITGGTNTMKDGKPGEQEDRRVEHIIPAEAVKRGSYTIYIEVTANGMFGLGPYRYQTPDVGPPHPSPDLSTPPSN